MNAPQCARNGVVADALDAAEHVAPSIHHRPADPPLASCGETGSARVDRTAAHRVAVQRTEAELSKRGQLGGKGAARAAARLVPALPALQATAHPSLRFGARHAARMLADSELLSPRSHAEREQMSADAHEEVAGEPAALQCAERALPSAPLLEQQQVLARDGRLSQRLRARSVRVGEHQLPQLHARLARLQFGDVGDLVGGLRGAALLGQPLRGRARRVLRLRTCRALRLQLLVQSHQLRLSLRHIRVVRLLKLGEPIHQGDIALLELLLVELLHCHHLFKLREPRQQRVHLRRARRCAAWARQRPVARRRRTACGEECKRLGSARIRRRQRGDRRRL